ncbi:MAG: [Firmicutes bacterium]|nr:[FeFe] hydrogenase H-cluster maturation GTPase HydF [Bacillota bacterium]
MGLNETPSGERLHIGFFGKRNVGKSSLVNAVTGQAMALVSDTKGTTTDPVQKAMELLPLGPVVIIDTPGYDDEGELGLMRVARTRQVLNRVDLAVLVVEAAAGPDEQDQEMIRLFREKEIPFLLAYNKCDLSGECSCGEGGLCVSAASGQGVQELKEALGRLRQQGGEKLLLGDLLQPGQTVVLVTPIDSSAPKGRLILPQQLAIRDILDAHCQALVTQEQELPQALENLKNPPAMVITDSQVFKTVAPKVPADVPLSSFSILMARYKGFLEGAVRGAAAIDQLKDGDKVLIAEGCTHHRQCEDIGTVKLPRWLRERTGKELIIETSSGLGFPEDLSPFALVIHCGGCMLNERELRYRRKSAADQNIPFTNYGTAIAYMNGILERSIGIFPDLRDMLAK